MASGVVCAVEGFVLNCGLLLAIGGQATFIVQQGMLRQHVAWVVLICSLCDAVLIGLGTLGAGFLAMGEMGGGLLALAGATFMGLYGVRSVWSAWHVGTARPELAAVAQHGLMAVVLATLAVTLLNPHVYLDAFVLLGGAATRYAPSDRPWFALGAITASIGWFVLLGRGAGLLTELFRCPRVRAALDFLIGLIMSWAAASLLIWS